MKLGEDIILIAGPTASGKTSAAIELAQTSDAVIINADSMQVYEDLRIVSARPSDEEIAQAPHFLFGHMSGKQTYSVAHWLEDVRPLMDRFLLQKRKMIFVGGTGLYFNALVDGLSPMPDIDEDIRQKFRTMDDASSQELHRMLDEKAAKELRPSDRQRIIRALEVYQATGKSIIDWQAEKGDGLIPVTVSVKKYLIMPERASIHERINMRFDKMVEEGALQEIETLLDKNFAPTVPVMKAIGVPQLSAHLNGEIPLDEAIEKSKAATRQYAKRQSTWFNNSFGEGWEKF